MTTINNRQDVMNSSDIIERLEELFSELEAHHDEKETTLSFEYALQDAENFSGLEEELEEYLALKQFAEQLESYGDWEHGETLIRESCFTEYAEDLAKDCGMVNESAGWPNNHIDWDAAAEQLKHDYTEATFDGVTYLMRA